MGYFEDGESGYKDVSAATYCPVCGKHGVAVLRVVVWNPQTHQSTDVCFKQVCLKCNKGAGRLVRLFTTADMRRLDGSLRRARLPEGLDAEAVLRAVEKHPVQSCYTPGEIAQYARRDIFGGKRYV